MKKKKILVICGAAMLAMFSFAATSMAFKPSFKVALAEEEEPVDTTAIAEEAAEETTNKFKQIWESYLLPAVLSVNVASVVSAAVTIVFAIKNFKNHKDYKTEITGVVKQVVNLSEMMVSYSIKMAEQNEEVKNLLIALDNADSVIEKQIALIEQEKECFEELKKATIALVNLEVELAKHNPEFVKNGLATQVVEIKNQLMKVAK